MKHSIYILAFILLVGCKGSKTVIEQSSTTKKDSTRTELIEREITPESSVQFVVPDSFFTPANWIYPFVENSEIVYRDRYDTIIQTDPTTGTELKVWRDRYNRLVAECLTKADTSEMRHIIENLKEKIANNVTTTTTVENREGWWKFTKWVRGFIAGVVVSAIAFFILRVTGRL